MHRASRSPRSGARRSAAAVAAVLLSLAGCTPDYPMDKAGTWQIPKGGMNSNDQNLRAMVVDPRDLTVGQAADGSVGGEATTPVRKLMAGRRAALPSTSSMSDTSGAQAPTSGQSGSSSNVQQ